MAVSAAGGTGLHAACRLVSLASFQPTRRSPSGCNPFHLCACINIIYIHLACRTATMRRVESVRSRAHCPFIELPPSFTHAFYESPSLRYSPWLIPVGKGSFGEVKLATLRRTGDVHALKRIELRDLPEAELNAISKEARPITNHYPRIYYLTVPFTPRIDELLHD